LGSETILQLIKLLRKILGKTIGKFIQYFFKKFKEMLDITLQALMDDLDEKGIEYIDLKADKND
jgi:hypothetical protein